MVPELTVPLPQAILVFEIRPVAEKVAQPAVPPPAFETKSCEVEAVPVTVSTEEVALVEKLLVLLAVVAKKLVEVEFVVDEVNPVSDWKVLEPKERKLLAETVPVVMLPKVPSVAKRLVLLAVVAKKFVVVALVAVALPPMVSEATVEEPSE